jgi:hypothetical protein
VAEAAAGVFQVVLIWGRDRVEENGKGKEKERKGGVM